MSDEIAGPIYRTTATAEYKYFLNDPNTCGLIFFKCIKERHNYARKLIVNCLDDLGWNELEVNAIVTGTVSHLITEFNTTERPDDIDEDGCDVDGTYWGDWYKRCDYKLTSLEMLNEPFDSDTDDSETT